MSYDSNGYTFYVSGDTTVEAVYGHQEEMSDVLIVMSEPVLIGTDKIAFFAERNLDSRYTVIESGILVANNSGLTTDSYTYRAIAKTMQMPDSLPYERRTSNSVKHGTEEHMLFTATELKFIQNIQTRFL